MDWLALLICPVITSVLAAWCLISSDRLCGNIWNFDENRKELTRKLIDLRGKRDSVLTRVTAEERKGRQRLPQVGEWLSEVEAIETDTRELIDQASAQDASSHDASADQPPSTTGCWSTDNISNCFTCQKVVNNLTEVRRLYDKEFVEVTEQAPLRVVEVQPVEKTFGLDMVLNKTWKSLIEDGNRMLGIYGMGGVGKTTLLKLINNKFDEVEVKKDFDVVIWVEVSQNADIGKIQDDIGKRIGLYDVNWCKKPQREKAGDIHRVLKDMKPRSILLLDDLWEQVSLADIGIPLLQGSKFKVVFTTRSKFVCENMEADENIVVECLGEKDAWDFFKQKAKCGRLSDEISVISKKIAGKCCGLPLAIEVIGKSLSSTSSLDEWRLALSTLESSPSEWKGTEKGIFQVLMLSYDYLGEKDAKCFQYCALFPEAYKITKDELVEYWIGERFIDEQGGRQIATRRGYGTISTLVGASLLLEDGKSKQKVYMNGMIREMALWIVTKFDEGEKFVVKAGVGLSKLPKAEDWKEVTKMSVMNNEIEHISSSSHGQARRKTLFLQNNKLVEISGQLFVVMSALEVLDLSRNPHLTELPEEIKKLKALRYLNLSGTSIEELPSGFGELTNLIHLDLESTPNLRSIKLVLGLWRLQVLRFYGSKASLDHSLLKKLKHSNYIEFLTITVKEVDVLEGLLGSKLAGKTQGLYLEGLEVSGAATLGEMASLGKLKMVNCDIIESETEWKGNKRHEDSPSTSSNPITPSCTLFQSLSTVEIIYCKGVKDLTWLIYAANLESLSVKSSPNLKQVISEKKAKGVNVKEPFLKLQDLDLDDLSELKSIYWTSLSFPKLKKVNISECPKLRKLPLNSTSVERIDDLRIQVDEEWLYGVEWESEAAKERFESLIILTASVS